eukprot:TRINITY_DN10200_c0_g1_i1.p1 TRINITY_DN10200_c0_g1~~TRINITY_DN10200_c0_g1_i1.p1  ORF type:complete len:419 (-),score=108.92 TRINITY_DN10200_c0_g1_i1:74-1330(-)
MLGLTPRIVQSQRSASSGSASASEETHLLQGDVEEGHSHAHVHNHINHGHSHPHGTVGHAHGHSDSVAPGRRTPSSQRERQKLEKKQAHLKSTDDEDDKPTDTLLHGPAARRRISLANEALLSGLAYCLSSCSMILLNKLVLSSFKWEAQISLMFYQNLVSVSMVLILCWLGLITTEPITWRLVRIWLPVNFIFVGMLITSFFSLQYMQVAMVTILKNTTNLITAVGEMYLFKKRHSLRVWGCMFLMIISALCGGATDLSFHALGYTWQAFNCFFTAAYSLTLRKVMDTAKAATKGGSLGEFSMVLLNNSLSLPLAAVLILCFGELPYVFSSPLCRDYRFWFIATLSGMLGLAISFTSMWFLHQTSPTTYSLVGSLNKIPLSIAGMILFRAPTSIANMSSILFGCFAGVLFARAKMSK